MSSSREEIVNEIRRLAAWNNGQPPGEHLFKRKTDIRRVEWRGIHWPAWSDALKEAGFQPNVKTEKLDDEFMLIKLAQACRHFGRFPRTSDLNVYRMSDGEMPGLTTYIRHFSSMPCVRGHLALWAERNKDLEVLGILRHLSYSHSPPVGGVVYLLRAYRKFKIGRSSDLVRRVQELRVSQSNALVLVHAIATDDPPGIEAYWHRRFADRRIRGEWFRLNSADVSAFKRRRYQ
jgi:hypothetical protein